MTLVLLGLASLLMAALVGILRPRGTAAVDRVVAGLILGGCLCEILAASRTLAGIPTPTLTIPSTLPGGAWVLGLDLLSAWFLLVVSVVGAASSVYGVGYLAPERGHRAVPRAHGMVALLLVALVVVVTAQSALTFLVAWEAMAIISYLLVVWDDNDPAVRVAGWRYLVVAHAGTIALVLLVATWWRYASDLTFSALHAAAQHLPAGGAGILVLALVGFGAKAGAVPLHVWLPGAHAGAPSHISALMSGVVIKTGIYGLLRVTMLLGAPPAWWGWTLLVVGTGSGVLGVLWALAQHDLKRLLAYHSVENIGIILIGAGLGSLGVTAGRPGLVLFGYAGAILHTLNHALFKSLLFLAAGAVVRATGTRAIDRLGGLGRRLPWTWIAFLTGSVAIVGLPPLNGFVSEWLIYQGLFEAASVPGALRLVVWGAVGLALIGALALACFAKVGGVVFLGEPRTAAAANARPLGPLFTMPMLALAAACLVIGVAPQLVLPVLLRVAADFGSAAGDTTAMPRVLQAVAAANGVATTAAAVLGLGLMALLARRWLLARHPVVRQETWGCGFTHPSPRMQYTAASFAGPLLGAYRPAAPMRIERSEHHLHTEPIDMVLEWTIQPVWHFARRAANWLTRLERARIQYLVLYLLAVLVLLLLLVALGADGR